MTPKIDREMYNFLVKRTMTRIVDDPSNAQYWAYQLIGRIEAVLEIKLEDSPTTILSEFALQTLLKSQEE